MSKLILLVGLPGSGKSTYAKKLKEQLSCNEEVAIHSSDALRKKLFGDESCQANNQLVFETLHRRVHDDLAAGKTVIYDATNISRKARRAAVNLAKKGTKIECHIIWAPFEMCCERDAARARIVGVDVIKKMMQNWQSPWYNEGFDEIKIIVPDEFDNRSYASGLVEAMKIPHDNPHHTLGVKEHCDLASKLILETTSDILLFLTAYWHDVGKPFTKSFKKKPGTDELDMTHAHYYDHQNVGAYMSYGLYGEDVNSTERVKISWLINHHMDPFFDTSYYRKLPMELKQEIYLLHQADVGAH